MKRKMGLLIILLMLSFVVVAGCGGHSLSGTYENGSSSFEFLSDGTFIDWESSGRFDGTYKIDGDVITLNVYGITDIMKFTDNPNELEYGGEIYTKVND